MSEDDNPVVKEKIETIGKIQGPEKCDYCAETDEEIKNRVRHSGRSIEYEFIDVDTDKAKDILEEEKIKGKNVSIPVVRKCDIHKDGKKDCTTIVGQPTKKDWVDMELDSLDSALDEL